MANPDSILERIINRAVKENEVSETKEATHDAEIAVDQESTEKITVQSREQKAILSELARLGGQTVGDDDIEQRGTKLVLPESMSVPSAISFLQRHQKVQEEETEFTRVYRFRPQDGANATDVALKRVTGSAGIPQATYGFFGTKFPPELRSIQVSLTETKQVPWGRLQVPLFEGHMDLTGVTDKDYGQLFAIRVEAPRKYRAHIEGFFDVVQDVLENESIYRGKAVNGGSEFLDLRTVDPTKTVYSNHVSEQLEANVWSLLKYSDTMRVNGLPLKRAVLMEGPYGTGKTLAAFQTAQVAVDNGWSFIYCRPGKDNLEEVMATARLYQPAVVFFEDVDEIAQPDTDDTDDVTRLLDMFDGISAKGTELVAIMTTNHVEKIHKGMVRPGRLDAVIHIGHLDAEGIEKLVVATAGDSLAEKVEWSQVTDAMNGYLPAFIKEAVDRAKRYSMAVNQGKVEKITTDDLVAAAEGLRDQLALMEDAEESKEIPYIDRAHRYAAEAAAEKAIEAKLDGAKLDYGNDRLYVRGGQEAFD